MRLDAVDPTRRSRRSSRRPRDRRNRPGTCSPALRASSTCWRSIGSAQSRRCSAWHAARRRPRGGSARGRRRRAPVSHVSATIRSSIACASANRRARFRRPLVVEDRGIIAGQLPGAEERRPVDLVAQFAQRPVVEARARRAGAAAAPCALASQRKGIGAGLVERDQLVLALVRAGDADHRSYSSASSRRTRLAACPTTSARGDARPRGWRPAHARPGRHRPAIDPDRGVDAAGGRAADQQRHRHVGALHLGRPP